MYSEADFSAIRRRILRIRAALIPALLALAGLAVLSLVRRWKALAYLSAAGLAVAAVFGIAFYLIPCLRYLRFLNDLKAGLSRKMTGTVVSVAGESEIQDGARVLPVHLLLDDPQDERIIYLNASKRDLFPGPGARVTVTLCGRHIREVREEAGDEGIAPTCGDLAGAQPL